MYHLSTDYRSSDSHLEVLLVFTTETPSDFEKKTGKKELFPNFMFMKVSDAVPFIFTESGGKL
jgi:hypothetical protein